MSIASVVVPVHVTIIKNWNYNDKFSQFPISNAISVTLNEQHLCAKATVIVSTEFQENIIFMNGRYETMANFNLGTLINAIKLKANLSRRGECWLIKAYCENNVHKGIGVDTKAAEYAAFAKALAIVYGIDSDLSDIVRPAYPPGCLSLYGGFTNLYKAQKDDVNKCAKPIIGHHHWPNLRILLVGLDIEDQYCKVPQIELLFFESSYSKTRSSYISPTILLDFHKAITEKDFPKFAELVMKESNFTQAMFMTAFPPIMFLNDISRSIIEFVHAYNTAVGTITVGYTFQQNPNPILFVLEENIIHFISTLLNYFPIYPQTKLDQFFLGIRPQKLIKIPVEFFHLMKISYHLQGKIQQILITNLGKGPMVVSDV